MEKKLIKLLVPHFVAGKELENFGQEGVERNICT
jgi:hypothetical protein